MAYKDKIDAQRWYHEHREQEIKKAKVRNKQIRARNYEYVNSYKSERECVDCGLKPEILEVLEFDHITDNKIAPIARLIGEGASINRIQIEINKCELVCANCHRIRTYKRRMGLV